MPLNKLAQEFGVAIVAICHQNKKMGLSAVQSIAGSGGFVQVARTVIAVINDPDDESTGFDRKRLMVVAKSNYGGVNEAQAYRLVDRGEGRVAIEWLPGVVEVDADAVVRGSSKGGDGRKTADLDAAVALVQEIMGRSAGVTPASEAEKVMKQAGHSRNTMKEAKRIAGVRSRKSGMSGGWAWEWDDKPSPVSGEGVSLDEWAANF